MPEINLYMIQAVVDEEWVNYEICRSLEKAIKMSLDELQGFRWRILAYVNERWIEYLASGSMNSVEHKDFRILKN